MTDPVKIIVGEGDITEVQVPEYNLIQTGGGGGGGGGSDGATFFPEVSQEGVISWTNDGGYDNPEPVNIKGPAGNDGSDGEDGQNGVTFTPSVSDAGIISWTNDGDLPNPSPVNIKGSDGSDGADGVSPAVTFGTITGGHTMTVTDKTHPTGQTINIMDGTQGQTGPGVPAGGTTGQVLAKSSNTDYATRWVDAGGNASLTILSYGHSTWSDFIAAYNSKSIVYCRASSGSDPASGSQTRLAFMAYVNSAASPANVEFQYYRSVSSHTDAQQGDQVFIYKLTNAGVWSVTTREAYTKIVAGTNMSSSYANGTLTLNATGGGGGTSDYDDLTDKPSINNVTLSGNKTAEDLGLGTYSKPSGGIPASDLASAVQTSLGKADTALQSVPSTYRTSTAQDAIDAEQDAQIESISRRNLLDNWYFVGGGSQLGYGTFPINQRGQTSYSTSGNGIDRWKASSSSMTYTVNRGGMLVKATAQSQQWYQILSNQSELAGKQVTLSALTTSNILIQTTVDIPSTLPSGTQTIGSGSSDANGYALYVRTMGGKLAAVVYAGSSFSSAGIAIVAMKLEIGSNQTLAHNEGTESNPNWVLNEIPDYGDELEKCQRYLFPVTTDAFFVGTTGANHTNPTFFVPTPTTMVRNPTTSSSISVNAQHGSGYVNGVALNVSSCTATTGGVRITTTGSTAIGTANYAMCLIQVVNTILLSAES